MARTLEVQVEQVGPATGKGIARHHTVFIDRPTDKGGEDRGPLGGELLLLSLGGCFLSTLLAAIRTRSAEVSNIRITVIATVGGVPERVEAMTLRVTASYSDGELMRRLVDMAERGCLVTNTLKPAMAITIVLENSSQ
ncbi:MAG TPA: OsmC family protein [Vicinamibacterales bacterium]|nr:OsmC family protein [Vicinamibacterales bacterium]